METLIHLARLSRSRSILKLHQQLSVFASSVAALQLDVAIKDPNSMVVAQSSASDPGRLRPHATGDGERRWHLFDRVHGAVVDNRRF